jgi:hypothetical protein
MIWVILTYNFFLLTLFKLLLKLFNASLPCLLRFLNYSLFLLWFTLNRLTVINYFLSWLASTSLLPFLLHNNISFYFSLKLLLVLWFRLTLLFRWLNSWSNLSFLLFFNIFWFPRLRSLFRLGFRLYFRFWLWFRCWFWYRLSNWLLNSSTLRSSLFLLFLCLLFRN